MRVLLASTPSNFASSSGTRHARMNFPATLKGMMPSGRRDRRGRGGRAPRFPVGPRRQHVLVEGVLHLRCAVELSGHRQSVCEVEQVTTRQPIDGYALAQQVTMHVAPLVRRAGDQPPHGTVGRPIVVSASHMTSRPSTGQ
jgi:hypothetical protein